MKTLHSNTYTYNGVKDGMHVFTKFLSNSDPEIIYLYRARYVLPDGTSVYYDPILDEHERDQRDRLYAYYSKLVQNN